MCGATTTTTAAAAAATATAASCNVVGGQLVGVDWCPRRQSTVDSPLAHGVKAMGVPRLGEQARLVRVRVRSRSRGRVRVRPPPASVSRRACAAEVANTRQTARLRANGSTTRAVRESRRRLPRPPAWSAHAAVRALCGIPPRARAAAVLLERELLGVGAQQLAARRDTIEREAAPCAEHARAQADAVARL
eukprot:scaffold126516_cov69-Phaeocystis_antarctica.AAC.1